MELKGFEKMSFYVSLPINTHANHHQSGGEAHDPR